ncbi:MAG: hypothetical protein A3F67_02250 [Verrucomicrobia bacterium RIFCSPHIGHO2_12_FULL_41_10]|nr:MAG: hypothetical protein A3F67_02250 [Verrucomicrobia bacterium RIFCSPHIGHO2_12_FULL_41_10]
MTRILTSFLVTVSVAVSSALALAWVNHGLGIASSISALMLGMIIGILAWCQIPHDKISRPTTFWEWLVIVVFTLASARAFLWLIYNEGDLIKVLSPNNLGDLSLHLTFIRYLARVTHWWPGSPILLQEPLRYPLGMDFFNSLLLWVGVPIERGLIWSGLIGALLTGLALWRWGGAFVMAAFLFNGGLGGILLWKGIDPDTQVQWKNLFLSMFVTQRGLLYALPVGLLLLTNWRESLDFYLLSSATAVASPTSHLPPSTTIRPVGRIVTPLWIQVILLGAMPLFSVHSFLFLGGMMVWLFFFVSPIRKSLFLLAFFSWPLAIFSAWLVSGGGVGGHFVGWHFGWMQEEKGWVAGFWFWLWNFGIALPLIFLLILQLLFRSKNSSEEARAFVFPAVLAFLACCIFRFAPWPWDNMKLMMWSWLTIAPFLWHDLDFFRNSTDTANCGVAPVLERIVSSPSTTTCGRLDECCVGLEFGLGQYETYSPASKSFVRLASSVSTASRNDGDEISAPGASSMLYTLNSCAPSSPCTSSVSASLERSLIKPRSLWLRVLLCFLLFGSGAVTLLVGLDGRHGYEIAKRSELATTEALLKNLSLSDGKYSVNPSRECTGESTNHQSFFDCACSSRSRLLSSTSNLPSPAVATAPTASIRPVGRIVASDVIATAAECNHPVLLLGHPVAAGYEGHLWSHGLAYQERWQKIHSIMMGEEGWETKARSLGIHAIYWSACEQQAFPHSQLPFAEDQKIPLLYQIK